MTTSIKDQAEILLQAFTQMGTESTEPHYKSKVLAAFLVAIANSDVEMFADASAFSLMGIKDHGIEGINDKTQILLALQYSASASQGNPEKLAGAFVNAVKIGMDHKDRDHKYFYDFQCAMAIACSEILDYMAGEMADDMLGLMSADGKYSDTQDSHGSASETSKMGDIIMFPGGFTNEPDDEWN